MAEYVTIDVLGRTFTFESHAEKDQAQKVADFVTERVNKTDAGFGRSAGMNREVAVMVLTVLGIANELLELKEGHQNFVGEIDKRSKRLLDMIK